MVGRAKVICSLVNFNLLVRQQKNESHNQPLLTDRRSVSTETWYSYPWAKYLVASSAIRAMREMFLATTLVLWEAAINHAALDVCSRLSARGGNNQTFTHFPSSTGISLDVWVSFIFNWANRRILGPETRMTSVSHAHWVLQDNPENSFRMQRRIMIKRSPKNGCAVAFQMFAQAKSTTERKRENDPRY